MMLRAPIKIPPGNNNPAYPLPNYIPDGPSPPIQFLPPAKRTLNYTARAVQFSRDPNSAKPIHLRCPALNCVDNGSYSFSFWAQGLTNININGIRVFVTRTSDDKIYDPFFGTVGVSTIQMNLGTSNGQLQCLYTPPFPNTDNNWHHYLGSYFTVADTGLKVGALYIDDQLQTPGEFTDFGAGSFICPVRGYPFYFGNDGENTAGTLGIADAWIAPGYLLLPVVPSGPLPVIPVTTRRIFTDITAATNVIIPSDPAIFPPVAAVLFTGPAATFGANLGFGGQFTLVNGSLIDIAGPSL